jgi:hypothetical protein
LPASRPGRFTPQGTPLLDRRLSGPQNLSGRRKEEKILPLLRLELQPFGIPAGSQSLYRLRCPFHRSKGSLIIYKIFNNFTIIFFSSFHGFFPLAFSNSELTSVTMTVLDS